MPNLNSMGPDGAGPMSGRGLGRCRKSSDSEPLNQGHGGNGRRGRNGKFGRQANGHSIRSRLEALEKAIFNKD